MTTHKVSTVPVKVTTLNQRKAQKRTQKYITKQNITDVIMALSQQRNDITANEKTKQNNK